MTHRTVVTLRGLDKQSIHEQIEQLRLMQRIVLPEDESGAATLSDTVRLLVQIEKALADQERVVH